MGKRRLGRGLGTLLTRKVEPVSPAEQVLEVALRDIKPNPWQPRAGIPKEALRGLVESIRANGVIQPIVLRRDAEGGFQIVAGERRWRAAMEAGLTEIPSVIREVPDTEMLLLALLENILREDLNPIERAQAYATLMKNLGWTQAQLAEHLSEGRATIANLVRLLELPEEIQDLVSRGTISAGHARALLGLDDPHAQARLCQRIVKESLSVRQTEDLVSAGTGRPVRSRRGKSTPPHIRELEERLQAALGAKITIKERRKGGRIIIDFFTHDDFDRILRIIEQGPPEEDALPKFHV